jgi:hypothetical protein
MKVKVEDAKATPGRAGQALKNGPHSKQQDADGSQASSPNPHGPTSGSNGLTNLAKSMRGESYRVGEHASSKELEAGHYDPREPKPKGTNPSDGSATTRVEPSRYNAASDPTAGGTVRAGKVSSDPCDSRGTPEEHHGEHAQAVVVSGRGPAAAKKQLGRNWLHGTLNADGKTTD